MTDRYYPVGKQSAQDVWKTTYETQNEMRSFQPSAYPPGYAGHEPGAREKFGFSTPGPDATKLTKSELALREDVDIVEPRRIHAMPRMQVTNERRTFRDLDMPEMDRSYRSAIMTPMYRSMAQSRSLPTLQPKPAPPKLSQLRPAQTKLQDDHFAYFVPKALSRDEPERLMSSSLPKLYKQAEKKVMLPFAGDGTGFRTACNPVEWWPSASSTQDAPTSYATAFKRPSFYRMSPSSPDYGNSRRSVQFDREEEEDGFGSIRLGTPTAEERATKHPNFGAFPALDSGAMQKSAPFPNVKPTPAARFGYMPPGAGRISRSNSIDVVQNSEEELSADLLNKILKLYQAMDRDTNGSIRHSDAKRHFKKFAEISTQAMFNEVDEDSNNEITFEEFISFWQQVRRSGYSEEDLSNELDELLKGNVWVDYADSRDVGNYKR